MKIKNIWKDINKNNSNENVKKEFLKIISYKSNKKVLIEIKNLKKSYKKFGKPENLIFDNVSFNIYEDEVLALLGSNGSGKTTIVEIISKIKKPTSGEVILNIDKEYKEPIGVQFQDITFPKSLTVKDLISFQIRMMESQVNQDLLDEMLNAFKLKDLLNFKISKLSGGQQQRLNVLIATLSKPKVLFLDEFTTGLDIAIKNEITNFIINYAKQNKITIVLISHDIDTISSVATRFVLLADKQLVIDADKSTILKKFKSVANFLYEYIV